MEFKPDPYRPISRARRLLIVVLAIAMAAFVVYSMTRKSGVVRNAVLHPADVAACKPGQTEGCVGSMTAVIAFPASTAASTAVSPAASPATSATAPRAAPN